MKRVILSLAVMAVVFPTAASYEEEWLYYIESPGGDNYYIDVDSIKQLPGDTVRVTEKIVFNDTASPLSMRIDDVELDCGRKKMRVLLSVNTFRGGRLRQGSAMKAGRT